MKKLFTSKPFLGAVLALGSVAIVIVCILVSRDTQPEFVPEQPQQSQSVSDWTESGGAGKPSVSDKPLIADTEKEAYPKVTKDDGDTVEIDFTPPQTTAPQTTAPESQPPEIPEGKTEIQDPGPSHPVNEDKTVKAPEPEPEKPSGPTPGSTNEQGQVYDPVFGWVSLSPVEQIHTDNDGDINKQVGSMD